MLVLYTFFAEIVGFDEVLQQKPNCPSVPSPLEIIRASHKADVVDIFLTPNKTRFTGSIVAWTPALASARPSISR